MILEFLKKKPKSKRKSQARNVQKQIWQDRLQLIWKSTVCVIVILPVLGGALSLNQLLFDSPTFMLKHIEVDGLKRLEQDEVAKLLPLDAGLPMMSLNLEQMLERLKSSVMVKDASIARVLPDTLKVRIEEREPFARLKYRRKYYEIDIDGVVVREIGKQELGDKILISGLRKLQNDVQLGQSLDSLRVHKALEIIKTLLLSEVSEALNVINVDMRQIKQVVLRTDRDTEIQLTSDNVQEQLDNLAILIKEKVGDVHNARYIDLRFQGVIIKPRN